MEKWLLSKEQHEEFEALMKKETYPQKDLCEILSLLKEDHRLAIPELYPHLNDKLFDNADSHEDFKEQSMFAKLWLNEVTVKIDDRSRFAQYSTSEKNKYVK